MVVTRFPKAIFFPKGTANTRPEIYVMGCRNPFRMGIDAKTGYVYWGDVGPDSGVDGEGRGPMGYDEINQARQAGNFGWPYFRGGTKVYHDYDFSKKKSGSLFNPENPINNSVNNTGLTELPPFNPSMIWYSYDRSKEFPWVGSGGKNPMAGPVFHSDFYESETQLPDFFDGRLFIYEWMRHWIYTVKFDSTGQPIKIDPFMRDKSFSRPMDMVLGPKGQLYILEYGNLWFARNMDARLVRIDYVKGNRAPIAQIKSDKTVGAAPLAVTFSSAECLDLDNDRLNYEWNFGDGSPVNKTAYPNHTFVHPGIYNVVLKITDADGQTAVAKQEIQAGNEAPKVEWTLAGNQTFYWDNRSFDYEVQVSDKEDGNLAEGNIDQKKVLVTLEYLPQGYDLTLPAQGHQTAPVKIDPIGKKLMDGSDCKNCHAKNKKVNGPSLLDIANKYRDNDFAARNLSTSIVYGSSGKWGKTAMIAHPQLTEGEATEMALYIMSLNGRKEVNSKFPVKGTYITKKHIGNKEKGRYLLMASYTDNGNEKIKPITGRDQIQLRQTSIAAKDFDESSEEIRVDGKAIIDVYHNSFVKYKNIDLTDIQALNLDLWLRENRETGGTIEVRLDDENGPTVARYEAKENGGTEQSLENISGVHDLYLVFLNPGNNNRQIVVVNSLEFIPKEG